MPQTTTSGSHRDDPTTQAGNWRLPLARRVAAVYSANPHVAATFVGGSVARGHADRFSDIEVGVLWHQPPTDAERLASAEATGGDVQRIYPYEADEEVWMDNLFLGHMAAGQRSTGVLVEVVHNTTEFIERVLEDVLVRYDPSELKQNLVAAFVQAIPVHGEALVEAWRLRTAVYPRELALAIIKRHGQIESFRSIEMMLERGNNLMLVYDTLVKVSKELIYLLLALNRIYFYSGFKWVHLQIPQMQITPPNFQRRLSHVFQSDPRAAIQDLQSLVEQTYDLIEEAMPEVDVERFRFFFRYRCQPWDQLPPDLR
ncbi:MAG: nucleotidyltransferase domain-containing protein [Chloroflexota bacterium]